MKTLSPWLAAIFVCSCIGCSADGSRRLHKFPVANASVAQPDSANANVDEKSELTGYELAVLPASAVDIADGPQSSNVVVAVDAISTTQSNESSNLLVSAMTLEELISLAQANNPAVKELAATTQKAAGFRTQVGLYANPTVGYQGQQLADRGTDQHLIFAEQEFVTGDKLELNRRVQNEALRAQLRDLEAQRLRVETDIQTLYYEALGYQKQLDLIKEFRGLMDMGFELAEKRFKASEGSKIDVLQTKVQFNEIDLSFRQTKARYDGAWREIAAVVGIQSLPPKVLIGNFPQQSAQASWDDVAASIVTSSPEFAAAQARISQARAELQRHGVQAIPNLTVQFGAGVDKGTNSGMMNLQVGAPIPVFNKNQGNIAAARAEYCRALMEAQRVESAIRARLAVVSRNFDSALEAVTVYDSSILPDAKEALQLAEIAYKAGEMDFVQLLLARRTYFESNLQYVASQSQLAVARAKVDGLVLSGSLDAIIDRSGSDSLRGLTFGQQ